MLLETLCNILVDANIYTDSVFSQRNSELVEGSKLKCGAHMFCHFMIIRHTYCMDQQRKMDSGELELIQN
jgi:hypothetical protein